MSPGNISYYADVGFATERFQQALKLFRVVVCFKFLIFVNTNVEDRVTISFQYP